MADQPEDKDDDIARRIWLAGIGVYGRAFGEAQGAAGKLGKESLRMFDDMVTRGKKIEEKVTETSKRLMPQTPSGSMDERIKRMRTALGLEASGRDADDRLSRMESQVAELGTKLDQIMALVEAQQTAPTSPSKAPSKAAPSKATPRRPRTRKTGSTAKPKPATKKPPSTTR